VISAPSCGGNLRLPRPPRRRQWSRTALVTGLGFITSIGNDRATVTRSLRELRPGLASIEFPAQPGAGRPGRRHHQDFQVDSASWRDWRYPAAYDLPRERSGACRRTACMHCVRWSRRSSTPGWLTTR